ncbi:lipopolysaccharide biosynthesis protein [Sphingobacterium detergens]|uniref:lipopolysaccharide biosynthesis protein n=1 Tax=Sphingobacterium detergens TaxID=1145106 RepID=UPI003AAF296A
MKNFIKSFLAFGLATSIEKLLGFILLPIYTRHFNSIEYGVIDMISVIGSILIIFGTLQIETSLQRYYYSYNGLRKNLLISNVYFLVFFFSFILFLILVFLSNPLAEWFLGEVEYSSALKISSFQIIFINLNMLGLVILRYEKQNVKFLIAIIIKVVTALLFALLFVVYLNLGINGVILGQTLSLFITTVFITFSVRNYIILRVSKIINRDLFQFALPQLPARIGSILIAQVNRFFMLGYLTMASIGIYSVSLKLASSIQIINTAFIMAWRPIMIKLFNVKNNKEIFPSVLPIISLIVFLCVSLISIFSLEIVKLFTTKEFYPANKYLGGLSLYFALFIVKEVIDIGPVITKNTKYLSYNFMWSILINIILLFALINIWQIEGVILSMVLTNLFLVTITWFTSNRLYPIHFRIDKFIFALIPALILSMANMVYQTNFLTKVITCTIVIFFYGIMLYRNRDILQMLKKI